MAPLTFMRISYYLLIQSHPASCWLTPLPNSHYREHCTLIKPNNTPVVSESRKYEEASARPRNSWLSSVKKKNTRERAASASSCGSPLIDLRLHVCVNTKVNMMVVQINQKTESTASHVGWDGVGFQRLRGQGRPKIEAGSMPINLSVRYVSCHDGIRLFFPYFNTGCYLLPPAMSLCSLRQRVIKL